MMEIMGVRIVVIDECETKWHFDYASVCAPQRRHIRVMDARGRGKNQLLEQWREAQSTLTYVRPSSLQRTVHFCTTRHRANV